MHMRLQCPHDALALNSHSFIAMHACAIYEAVRHACAHVTSYGLTNNSAAVATAIGRKLVTKALG